MKLVIPVLALALVAADAFRVDVSDVAPPVDILGEHQELERTFKVYSDDALEKISVGIAGPVFIAYKDAAVETPAPTTPEPTTETPTVTPEVTTPEVTTPEPTFTPDVNATQDGSLDTSSSSGSGSSSSSDDTIVFPDGAVDLHAASHKEKLVATVTVSGNSSAMLELIEIVPHKKDKTDGLRLTYKNTDATVEGYVLTQIEVANKHDVRHVTSELASVVDVATNVLSQDTKKAIKIRSVGASNVFVSDQGEVKADHVELTVAGSGSIQVIAGSLKLDGTLSTTLTGSGALALHADSVQASKLDTSVSGSGALFVVTKSLAAKDFSGSVYGSAFASVSASDAGHVESEDFTVAGSGAMYAGSIVANKSSVDVWGSGQAYVQVTDKLKTSASYSGQVYYVGAKPAVVKTSGWWFWRSQVKAAESDKTMPHEIVSSPRVYPEYIALELRENHHDKEPRIKVVDEATTTTALLTTHLAAVAHGPHGVWIFAGVATGLVAMAMLAQSYQQHRVRRHYTPLV